MEEDYDDKTTCDNCGTEYDDDGDVFDCVECRDEVCVGCEGEHLHDECPKVGE